MAEAESGASLLRDVRRRAAARLAAAGLEDAQREADLAIRTAMGDGVRPGLAAADTQLSRDDMDRIEAVLDRRVRREPLSRITGAREFYGRPFALSPETLDPRPETETVVDAALELLRGAGLDKVPIRILDLGTGTGALLLTLLAELPQATGLGTDISPGALATARSNAAALGVSARAAFRNTRSLEGIEDAFDVLVSNPPYIPSGEIDALEPEVRAHDPRLALDGGADGLDVYRDIAAGLARVVPKGFVVLEIGQGQAADVSRLLALGAGRKAGPVRLWTDLAGHVRCVAMQTQF